MNQTLLGVTGSGKTFTVANVIANTGKNALIISHNKTLAAQLYSELKQFFPKNNVGYFVSYYDYYQPESYMPQTDTYIEKDTQINEKIEKMRLEATAMLLSGEPTIIVSTVSCIYSLGSPKEWEDMAITLKKNEEIARNEIIKKLINARYERNDVELIPGNGGKLARSAGSSVTLSGYDGDYAILKLSSGETRKVSSACIATIGIVSNPDQKNIKIGKAGRNRWRGKRPQTRGVAMNPVDHPHGGGEGKTSGGRSPVSPWGQSAKGLKTRRPKRSDKLIIMRRRKRNK